MSTSKHHFIQRRPFASPYASEVTSVLVCAERPNVEIVETIIKDIMDEAPLALSEYLYGIFERRKTWDKAEFERSMSELRGRVNAHLETDTWEPSPDLKKQLATTKLTTDDQVEESHSWLDNLEEQIRSIRFCHLRSIAKKGVDLDGTRYHDAHLKPADDPATRARIGAAYEVLTLHNIRFQAEMILQRAIEDSKGGNIDIHCIRPVKDYSDTKNSYNFLTAVYSKLMRDELEAAAKELYPNQTFNIIDEPVMMLTHTNRTDATPLGRILKQPLFEIPELTDRNVVIFDDHINAGAFAATLSSQLEESGAHILGSFAYSRHPHSKQLSIIPPIRERLVELCDEKKLDGLLQCVGLSVDTLTNREAMTMIAILSDGECGHSRDRYEQLCAELRGKHSRIVAGKQDDLDIEMSKPAENPDKLVHDIEQLFKSGQVR